MPQTTPYLDGDRKGIVITRALHRLTSSELRGKEPGKHADGGGLWFYKRTDGGAQWVLRYTLSSRRHEMGLGSFTAVSLKEARQETEKWRAVVRTGTDAIKERERQRREAERNMHILSDIALDAFESRKAELKGDGRAGRWFIPLELHVLPKLGNMPVGQIDSAILATPSLPSGTQKPTPPERP